VTNVTSLGTTGDAELPRPWPSSANTLILAYVLATVVMGSIAQEHRALTAEQSPHSDSYYHLRWLGANGGGHDDKNRTRRLGPAKSV
jgi:hypothetical protein